MSPDPVKEAAGDESDRGGGGEQVSGEGLQTVKKMVTRLEASLLRKITGLEGGMGKLNDLQDEMQMLKLDLARALAPKEP